MSSDSWVSQVLELSNCDDLSPQDALIVSDVARVVRDKGRCSKFQWRRIAPIVNSRNNRLPDFNNSISSLLASCLFAADIDVPQMSDNHRQQAVKDLSKAISSLNKLKRRIKNND